MAAQVELNGGYSFISFLRDGRPNSFSELFELALVLVRLDYVASRIVNANHSTSRRKRFVVRADGILMTFLEPCTRPFIASLNGDKMLPKCHWTALRRHCNRVVSLVWRISEWRADAFFLTVVSARTAPENVHQCDAGKH